MKYRAQSPYFDFFRDEFRDESRQRIIGHNLDVLFSHITRHVIVEKSNFPHVIRLSIIKEHLDFKIVADIEVEPLELEEV